MNTMTDTQITMKTMLSPKIIFSNVQGNNHHNTCATGGAVAK